MRQYFFPRIRQILLLLIFSVCAAHFVQGQYVPDSLEIRIRIKGEFEPQDRATVRVMEGLGMLGSAYVQIDKHGWCKMKIAAPNTEGYPLIVIGEAYYPRHRSKMHFGQAIFYHWKRKTLKLRLKYERHPYYML